MSRYIDEKVKAQIQPVLASLVNPVKIVFFTQKNACSTCLEQEELLRELSAMSTKITLEVYDFVLNGDEVMKYKVDKIPATAVVGKRDFSIRFYGLTVGYEFKSLLQDIVMVSTERTGLDPGLEIMLKTIADSVHLQIMVTLTCPQCQKMVQVAHQLAFLNNRIQADMVELTEFPNLAIRYSVTGPPKTIINELYSFVGAVSAEQAYLEILKAVNPQEYEHLKKEMTQM